MITITAVVENRIHVFPNHETLVGWINGDNNLVFDRHGFDNSNEILFDTAVTKNHFAPLNIQDYWRINKSQRTLYYSFIFIQRINTDIEFVFIARNICICRYFRFTYKSSKNKSSLRTFYGFNIINIITNNK